MLLIKLILQGGRLESLIGKGFDERFRFGNGEGHGLRRFIVRAVGKGEQLLIGGVEVAKELQDFIGEFPLFLAGNEIFQDDEEVDGDRLGLRATKSF